MYKNTKRPASKETLFVFAALICMFLMIIITSIADAGLDPAKIFTVKNFSNALINASITIFGIVAAIPSGAAATKQRVNADGTNGRYLQEFHDYYDIRTRMEPRRFMFSQWHYVQYFREFDEKRLNYLIGKGIFQAHELMDLSREQILMLTTSQKFIVNGQEKYYKALSPNQIIAALRVYDGKINVNKLPDFYFLYIDGRGKRSFYDQAYYQDRDEKYTMFSKLIFKIFIGLAITSIFTSLMIEYRAADSVNAAFIFGVILTIITRTFNALTSTFWGYLIGQEVVYKQCYYINGKTQFLRSFDADDKFVYRDIQTIAREEYLKDRGKELEDGRTTEPTSLEKPPGVLD